MKTRPPHRWLLGWLTLLVAILVAMLGARDLAAQVANDEESLMRRAETHMVAGEFDRALPLYAQLFGQTRRPVYLRNLARCHQMLRHPDEAILNFRQYLATPDLGPDERREIEGFITEMEELKRRQQEAAYQRSMPPPPAPAPMTPPASSTLETSTSRPGVTASPLRTLGLVAMVAGGVGVGTGAFFGLRARQLEEQVTNAKTFDEKDDQAGKSARTLQFVGYGVGVALAGAGLALWLLAPDPVAFSLSPNVGASHAMLELGGRF